jgi:hypothetical protein
MIAAAMSEMACLQPGAVYPEAIWLSRRTIRATGAIGFWTTQNHFRYF